MVARLATVRTTAALEGPLRVGPINFWKSPLKGLYVSVRIILQHSTLFYDLQIRIDFYMCMMYDVTLYVHIYLLFSSQARCLVDVRSVLWPRRHPRSVSEKVPSYSAAFRVLLMTPKYLQNLFSYFPKYCTNSYK